MTPGALWEGEEQEAGLLQTALRPSPILPAPKLWSHLDKSFQGPGHTSVKLQPCWESLWAWTLTSLLLCPKKMLYLPREH